MNISFLENWQIDHKLTALVHTHQAWKTALTIRQSMKVSKTQENQFSDSLVNWEEFGSKASANIQKSQYFIPFMNWKKSWNPTRSSWTTLTNLRTTFKNRNFEFIRITLTLKTYLYLTFNKLFIQFCFLGNLVKLHFFARCLYFQHWRRKRGKKINSSTIFEGCYLQVTCATNQ